jgi:hypothetical protein
MITATYNLVCQFSDARLHATWSDLLGVWDLDHPEHSQQQRKEDRLAVLETARTVMAALQRVIQDSTMVARRNGTDWGEIDAAQGISRQAARQAAGRRTMKQTVTLVGGPRDGEQESAVPASKKELRFEFLDVLLREHRWWFGEQQKATAVYRRKYGSPATYEFAHFESHDGEISVTEPDVRPRIHQMAYAWGFDSERMLAEAKKIDRGIRTRSVLPSRPWHRRAVVRDLHGGPQETKPRGVASAGPQGVGRHELFSRHDAFPSGRTGADARQYCPAIMTRAGGGAG